MTPFVLMFFIGIQNPEVPPSADVIRFKARQALVSDSAGDPIFIGTRDFVLKKAHNQAGTVVRYDALSKRVRVSTVGTELWLSCSELEPMASACPPAVPSRRLRSVGQPAEGTAMSRAGVPSCPGDPRCPKID